MKNTATITEAQKQSIATLVQKMHLPSGLGDEENACSVAAINLALTGKLTDTIPDCMSEVIGRWIIGIQDAMPDEMRNSPEWKNKLPDAAGTGRTLEAKRSALILEWMWGTVLVCVQPAADTLGFGTLWQAMCEKRTYAANAAANAANAAAYAANAAAANAANAAAYAANAAAYAANAAAYAANAAAYAANAAANAAKQRKDYWQHINPCLLLQNLIDLN